jgi:hypothetical protein
MTELATRQAALRLLRPSAVRLDVPASLLPDVWPIQDAMPSGEEYAGPDAPAAAPVRGTEVRPLGAEPEVVGTEIRGRDGRPD